LPTLLLREFLEWIEEHPMTQNKKTKKQLDLARRKKQELQQRLAGEKKQMDNPDEVKKLEAELVRLNAEIEKLQNE
jgi:hypothetical protein